MTPGSGQGRAQHFVELSALKAVTASQRAQLDELLRATLAAAPPAAKTRVPRSTGKAAAKRTAQS